MRALIVYDSLHGNTEAIAEAIAEGLTEGFDVRLLKADLAGRGDLDVDLLIVGGPTHNHRASGPMRDFLDRLERRSLHDARSAAFDTRYRMTRWMTGSAALEIYRELKRAGATVIDEPQSFFVEPDQPHAGGKRRHELERLEPGETERARAWASDLFLSTASLAR